MIGKRQLVTGSSNINPRIAKEGVVSTPLHDCLQIFWEFFWVFLMRF